MTSPSIRGEVQSRREDFFFKIEGGQIEEWKQGLDFQEKLKAS
jgi:hypothetical protein